MTRHRIIIRSGSIISVVLFMALASACSSPSGRRVTANRSLTLNDFVRVDAGSVGPEVNVDRSDDESRDSSSTSDNQTMPPTLGDGTTLAAGPTETPPGPTVREPVPGELVVIDSLVGEVNGRPIYAEEFFAPLDAFLFQRARTLTPPQFEQLLSEVIQNQLKTVIQNELFLAQARATLTPEQQQGLFHWMGQIQENLIAQGGGTRAAATNRLLEDEGTTLDEKVREITDIALLRRLFEEKIKSRVIVSWRDIQREYERNREQYNAPARVKISHIRLFNDSDAAKIEDVNRRLAAGESFRSIAESLGQWDEDSLGAYRLGPDGMAGIELQPQFREPLVGLGQGDTTEAIVTGTSTWWLHISEFLEPVSRSIYDPEVQLELRRGLESRLLETEQNRFLESLIDDTILDDLTAMRDRLMVIARRRYRP